MILVGSLLFTVIASHAYGQEELAGVCGDCWCVPDPVGSDCRTPEVGIADHFPQVVADIYGSYEATNCIPLQTPDGSGDCYPFANIAANDTYPGAALPQCEIYGNNDEGFCAFVFEDENGLFENLDQCAAGRKYAMETFATLEEIPANAALTHQGACGVCSSAQDLSVRMTVRDELQTISVLCGTRYFFSGQDFGKLVECYSEEGFTPDCATLWGHFTATNAASCAQLCVGHEPPFNGLPPECEHTDCLKCSFNISAVFDDIAGRTQPRSGITENIGRPCSEFYPVVHDACPGVNLTEDKNFSGSAAPSSAAFVNNVVAGLVGCGVAIMGLVL